MPRSSQRSLEIAATTGPGGTHASSPAARDEWERLAALCAGLLAECETSGLVELADVVSVNLPYDADEDTPRRVTSVARVGYDRLFRPEGDGVFVHDFTGGFVRFDPLDGSDVEAAHRGRISITPLRLVLGGGAGGGCGVVGRGGGGWVVGRSR
jgi:broad specificity polyphosphatase/5'/3'-nucleotidase SurE